MATAFLFPGQGAQTVGMGCDLCEAFAEARGVFDQAERATGLPLRKLCFEGPEEELARTDVCQPAIFTVSAAVLAVLAEQLGPEGVEAFRPAYLAGLSLGEYTALYAADAIDLAPAVRLVARRGELMQAAAVATPSGMLSVMGLDEEQAWQLVEAAAEGETLTCANFNCPGQIVLSGTREACRRAERLAGDFGARMAAPLKVAGAFHSEAMAPAAEKLAEALRAVEFRTPRTPVVANIDARPHATSQEVRDKLLIQLTGAVRWQQSMEFLLESGVRQFYEIGPGRVLAGLMRRIDRSAKVTSLDGLSAVERLLEEAAAR
ncbi:MAG TPA: ACP S-malonyltransferase [Phycisphaerae bacterium]|nr:ACP S-malonyltransferase [Phycisphaerae bacterium]